MIKTINKEAGETVDNLFVLDIGRPSFFNEDQRLILKRFHDWCLETDIDIVVNNCFHWLYNELCIENSRYGGGGFKYCFWFKLIEDKDLFLNTYIEMVSVTFDDSVEIIYD